MTPPPIPWRCRPFSRGICITPTPSSRFRPSTPCSGPHWRKLWAPWGKKRRYSGKTITCLLYTSLHLARILASYCGPIKVHVVPFTEIQDQIRKNCQEDLFTVLMRRFMMRIAQRVARRQDCGALITGESLGQVASQTLEAIGVTNAVCELPVQMCIRDRACARGRRSHVLEAMKLPAAVIDGALRVSFCPENTQEDVKAFLAGLQKALGFFL